MRFVNIIQNLTTLFVQHFFQNSLTITQYAYIIRIYAKRVDFRKEVIVLNNYKYPNIEAERVRIGLTQAEITEKLGYKERRSYFNWLTNGNIPTSTLIKMSEIFGCSIDYLLGRSENRKGG